ncbi:MAG: hypothetical protein H0V66_02410 [Bdellovibrionales bacterium]|nr:hypothetical protein [Bdellovibrionales bacterium]
MIAHDRNDPDAWLAIETDMSLPMDPMAKAAWVKDSSRWTRQFLFPIVKPCMKFLMALIQIYKFFFPKALTSSLLLHRIIVKGLKTFVTPEGNLLLIRHFHLGSQVLEFLKDNVPEITLETIPLSPMTLDDFKDNLILKHDVNLYNFVIDLNRELKEKNIKLSQKSSLNFSSLSQPPITAADLPQGKFNFIDIQTAIELILPLFQLLLTDREFWRSTHSLQLDETMGLYFAQLLGMHNRLFLVNNRHPLIPASTGEAGHRLALHSLSTEILHGLLMEQKKA